MLMILQIYCRTIRSNRNNINISTSNGMECKDTSMSIKYPSIIFNSHRYFNKNRKIERHVLINDTMSHAMGKLIVVYAEK
jgi:hypothetical protein